MSDATCILDHAEQGDPQAANELLPLVYEELRKLAAIDPVGARLVKLRFFVGLPNVEAARLLGLPERTAKRTWAYARAWPHEEWK